MQDQPIKAPFLPETETWQRWKLCVAYDGAGLRGWQSQSGGQTVQDHLEWALQQITGQTIRVVGAGRTDAGVHALRQYAHADLPPLRMDARAWKLALNNRLPPAIRVMAISKVPSSFHARFDAVAKHYRYTIHHAETLPPFEAGRVWLIPQPLDLEVMQEAASKLVGTHDFRRFSAIRKDDQEYSIRTLTHTYLRQSDCLITLDMMGNGFLYKMVRITTALLVRVGLRKMSPSEFEAFLNEPSGPRATHCAPPDGLVLVDVFYPKP